MILLGAILTAVAMLMAASLGVPSWQGLAALPAAGFGWWQVGLWRELRLRRAVTEAAPYRIAIYGRDRRLLWHNGHAGRVLSEALASLPPRPPLEQILKATLSHRPPPSVRPRSRGGSPCTKSRTARRPSCRTRPGAGPVSARRGCPAARWRPSPSTSPM